MSRNKQVLRYVRLWTHLNDLFSKIVVVVVFSRAAIDTEIPTSRKNEEEKELVSFLQRTY